MTLDTTKKYISKTSILFCHMWWDGVWLSIDGVTHVLQKHTIELRFSQLLTRLYTHYNFDTVYVLHGPWSFTNLRIASLIFNTLNILHQSQITFFGLNKLAFYQQLYKTNTQGREDKKNICLYIWQKKNIWLVDITEEQDESLVFTKLIYEEYMAQPEVVSNSVNDFLIEPSIYEWWEKSMIQFLKIEGDILHYCILDNVYTVSLWSLARERSTHCKIEYMIDWREK